MRRHAGNSGVTVRRFTIVLVALMTLGLVLTQRWGDPTEPGVGDLRPDTGHITEVTFGVRNTLRNVDHDVEGASPKLSTPAVNNESAVAEGIMPSPDCLTGRLLEFPLTGLELELQRLAKLTAEVMSDVGAVYWPTDGTLLGLMRNGRVSTDRDLDYQIHATYDTCFSLLSSLKSHFEKRARIKSFKVVKTKWNGKRIGRYVMVRLLREHGTFDTGPDFNCVYTDDVASPKYYTHRGVLTPVPKAVYPLGWCLMYGTAVPCPKDGMSVLESLKPRYEGCMVFPHCIGDPAHSSRRCLSPHPVFPLQKFVDSTVALAECGFTSLKDHFQREPSCASVLSGSQQHCEVIQGTKICFLQKYDG